MKETIDKLTKEVTRQRTLADKANKAAAIAILNQNKAEQALKTTTFNSVRSSSATKVALSQVDLKINAAEKDKK